MASFKENCFPREEDMMEKTHQPSSLQDIKDTMETSMLVYFQELLK